jgi:hypothetical protein
MKMTTDDRLLLFDLRVANAFSLIISHSTITNLLYKEDIKFKHKCCTNDTTLNTLILAMTR